MSADEVLDEHVHLASAHAQRAWELRDAIDAEKRLRRALGHSDDDAARQYAAALEALARLRAQEREARTAYKRHQQTVAAELAGEQQRLFDPDGSRSGSSPHPTAPADRTSAGVGGLPRAERNGAPGSSRGPVPTSPAHELEERP